MDIYLFDSEESFRKFNKSMSDIFGLEHIELQYNPEHYKLSSDMDNNFKFWGRRVTETFHLGTWNKSTFNGYFVIYSVAIFKIENKDNAYI